MKSVLVIVAMLLSQSLMASSMVDIMNQYKKSIAMKAASRKKIEKVRSCVNFSGEWKGSCVMDNGHMMGKNEEIKISQTGCRAIWFEGDQADVWYDGSLKSETSTSPDQRGIFVSFSDWNPTGTEFLQRMKLVSAGDWDVDTQVVARTFLENDRLKMVTSVTSFSDNNNSSVNIPSVICTYDRK